MAHHSIEIQLPYETYKEIENNARQREHSVAQYAADLLIQLHETGYSALPIDDQRLPPELEAALADLALLSDEALQKVASDHFPQNARERLADLNYQAQATSLTAAEIAEQERLLEAQERLMLLRSKAVYLLWSRQHELVP